MTEYLVRLDFDRPDSFSDSDWAKVVAEERSVGQELVRQGSIVSIFRIAGTTSNVGIWRADNSIELERLLRSLPAYPWATVETTELIDHPLSSPISDRNLV